MMVLQMLLLLLLASQLDTVSAQAGAGAGWALGSASGEDWPYHSFYTEPEFSIPMLYSNRTAPTSTDPLFMMVQGGASGGPMIVSDTGDLLWHSQLETGVNLTPGILHGKPVFFYWNGTSMANLEAYGSIMVFDNTYTLIHEVVLNDPAFGTDQTSQADVHEAYLTDHGTVLLTAAHKTPMNLSGIVHVNGTEEGYIWDCHVYEVNVTNSAILFSWKTSDHLDEIPLSDSLAYPSTSSTGWGNSTDPWDPYHLNSITTYDGGYVFSLRHTASIYHIDSKGAIVWQIHGDGTTKQKMQHFSLGEDTGFLWQHDARISKFDGQSFQLSLHANQNIGPDSRNASYGLVLHVDLKNSTVTKILKLEDPVDKQVSFAGGSLQYLGNAYSDHWLLDFGIDPVVKEFDRNGSCIMTVQFGLSLFGSSYRVYRSQWNGFPSTKPKTVACHFTDGLGVESTRVYASWNGATDVRGWEVFAGDEEKQVRSEATAGRVGFETSVELGRRFKYVQVQAQLGSRKTMGKDGLSKVAAVLDSCATLESKASW